MKGCTCVIQPGCLGLLPAASRKLSVYNWPRVTPVSSPGESRPGWVMKPDDRFPDIPDCAKGVEFNPGHAVAPTSWAAAPVSQPDSAIDVNTAETGSARIQAFPSAVLE